jgi:hypothetical protein
MSNAEGSLLTFGRHARHKQTLRQLLIDCEDRQVTEKETDTSKVKRCKLVFGGCSQYKYKCCPFSHHPAVVVGSTVAEKPARGSPEADYWGKPDNQLWVLAWGDIHRHSELFKFVEKSLASNVGSLVYNAHARMLEVAKALAEEEEDDKKEKEKEQDDKRKQKEDEDRRHTEDVRQKEARAEEVHDLLVHVNERRSCLLQERFRAEPYRTFITNAFAEVVEPARVAAGTDRIIANFDLATLVGESDGGSLHWRDDKLKDELLSNDEVRKRVKQFVDAFWYSVLLHTEQFEGEPPHLTSKAAKRREKNHTSWKSADGPISTFVSWCKHNPGEVKRGLGPLFVCLSQDEEVHQEVHEEEHEELEQEEQEEQQREKAVSAWKVDDVCAWITEIELGAHADSMRRSSIDGLMLLSLADTDLQILGITDPFHRRKVLQRRDGLALQSIPTTVALPTTTVKKIVEKKDDLARRGDAVMDAIGQVRSAEKWAPQRHMVQLCNILDNVAVPLLISLFKIAWNHNAPASTCACGKHHEFSEMSSACI